MAVGISAITSNNSPVSSLGSPTAARSGMGASSDQAALSNELPRLQSLLRSPSGSGAGGGTAAASGGAGGDLAGAAQGMSGQMSPEQQQMQATQQAADKQQEAAALAAALEKSRHDAMMAIIGKIG